MLLTKIDQRLPDFSRYLLVRTACPEKSTSASASARRQSAARPSTYARAPGSAPNAIPGSPHTCVPRLPILANCAFVSNDVATFSSRCVHSLLPLSAGASLMTRVSGSKTGMSGPPTAPVLYKVVWSVSGASTTCRVLPTAKSGKQKTVTAIPRI